MASATPVCGYCRAEVPGDFDAMREHVRRSHNGNYSAPPPEDPRPPTPDAGEVRTYREGVEDAARVCAEWSTMLSMRVDDLIRIRAPQRTVKAIREAANQVLNVEAAIRKLP